MSKIYQSLTELIGHTPLPENKGKTIVTLLPDTGGPWFVVGKDIERNVLFVANGKDPEQQYGHEFLMRDFHFITADPWDGQADIPVSFKIRHTDSFMKGVLKRDGMGYSVRSEQRMQGIAPGQFGVIYDAKAKLCLGSGEISTGQIRAVHQL